MSKITAFGETKTVSEWAKDRRAALGVTANMLRQRLGIGWDPEKAITHPTKKS
jgi:hypothetical protein